MHILGHFKRKSERRKAFFGYLKNLTNLARLSKLDDLEELMKRQLPKVVDGLETLSCIYTANNLEEFIKKIHGLIPVHDVMGGTLLRCGNPSGDGGYVMLDELSKCSLAYSFGIYDDMSWDLEMARRGIDVFIFERSKTALPTATNKIHWGGMELADRVDDVRDMSLSDIVNSNGHYGKSGLLLKINSESAERISLLETGEDIMKMFDQIFIEMNCLNDCEHEYRNCALLSKLLETHVPFHVHANNCTGFSRVKDITLPFTLEVSYVKKSGRELFLSRKLYPTSVDVPCKSDSPDIDLGLWNI